MPVTRADVARWWIANGYHVLDIRQQEVLILRFGLFGEPAHYLTEVGEMLRPPATADEVDQIEMEAITILRETYCTRLGRSPDE